MNYDVPKIAIIAPKPPAEYCTYDYDSGPIKNDASGDTGQTPAPDLGGFPIQPKGDTGTAGTSNASITSSGINNSNYSAPYIIPRDGPILEAEINLQIEAKNLQEAGELARKG